ncbi:HD family hydrolase [Streptomyces sp. WAC08241]|uniref:HD domain-containing protein n=1 Tax=Streptomyces sp. WAC08241 TaxID=2487421 RepID=UPI000F7697F0|nr:HD domain-containing protein [Streptomyces sp. WAC08241]RSS43219.1 HD domain-containing protein [Streptomyces sp. WAC08241]
MADETANAQGTAGFIFEMGVLKNAKRTGWWFTGNNNPESIAEHSFRVGVIGAVLAMMEDVDPAQVALMCLFHDTQETRIGDIPHIGRRYIDAATNRTVTADQVSAAHPAVRAGVQRVVEEYEANDTPEAIVAKDADKLECLVQAVEYRAQGNTLVQDWIDTSLNSLKTASARALAEAALTMSPLEWRKTFLS